MENELKNVLENEFGIPKQTFTQEALDLFDIIRQKLYELRIESNEAREYFCQFIRKIQELGFIPPLIINLLRDVDNNYQTLIVSKNLSAEEEKIIAACIKPMIIGTNEIAPIAESRELTIATKEIIPSNNLSSYLKDISKEIYNAVIKITQEDEKLAKDFTDKAMSAMVKLFQTPPLKATHCPFRIAQLMRERPRLQINQTGILSYFQNQMANILPSGSVAKSIDSVVE